jgi:hypothetical protein
VCGRVVSLFISQQATGTFKYHSTNRNVYDYADRNFKFDDEFLQPTLLPPGTPMFRDINLLTFRQILRPNQSEVSRCGFRLQAEVHRRPQPSG